MPIHNPPTVITDHGLLSGLGDDDHSIYALLSGRAGGQVLIGGTAAGEDLTLQSSAHATKGKILLGAAGNSVYDEVNDRLGIGESSPESVLELNSGSSPSGQAWASTIAGNTVKGRFGHTGADDFQLRINRTFGDAGWDDDTKAAWAIRISALADDISFFRAPGGGAWVRQMVIRADGSVAIGSHNPSELLHIKSDSNTGLIIESQVPRLFFWEMGGPSHETRWDFFGNAGQLLLRAVNDAGSAANNIMTVDRTGYVVDRVTFFGTEFRISGDLDHNGSNVGFFGVAPAARAAAYTVTNAGTDRAYDADATTLEELADVLGTVIADLTLYGLLQ